MNENQRSEIPQNERFLKSDDVCYEDDGFFSDVPCTGSFSKSRMALNKYLKKNLLYEDVGYKEDSAYFSKESSPNESVSKSDNESGKDNESSETKRRLSHELTITELVKSYESDRQEISNVNNTHPIQQISNTVSEDSCNLHEINSHMLENNTLLEFEEKDESDYKVYPKERWPDKYRRNSDTIRSKPSEINRTKRSMSHSATIEEFAKSYELKHRNDFLVNNTYQPNQVNKECFEPKQSLCNVPNIEVKSIRELSSGANLKKYDEVSEFVSVKCDQTNRRLTKNFNIAESIKFSDSDHMELNSNGTPYLENDLFTENQLSSGNRNSASHNKETCFAKQPQEAVITITKIVKSYVPEDQNVTVTSKQHLNIPINNVENPNNIKLLETKLPSPVPLPRKESLKKNFKPNVAKRTVYCDDNEFINYTQTELMSQDKAEARVLKPSGKSNAENFVTANVEQTDDYKCMQLLEKPKLASHLESSDDAKCPILSGSLTNLSRKTSPDDVTETVIVYREKYVRPEEHRHTLHDFTGWVNRTTKYPDVYAPMPYKSPRRYVESDVNIHYRCPVRHDPLPLVPERELARQQAEHMKRLYREQKRNKYLQELQDMQSRRHQDNFLPKEKSVVPLNRYDEAERIVARALYAFNGQTARELSFRKGDLINVRRQIDANWYEGELHGRSGLFPYNYVEILKGDVATSPRKPSVIEGRARAKFDFIAQTNLELPLKKGELVVLTRRIDQNWWEGRNGHKTGIFPDSYVTVLQEPSQSKPEPESIHNTNKPVASPAAHGLMNGTAKRSMGPHSYMPQPNNPALSNAPQPTQPLQGYSAKPVQALLTPSERGYGPPTTPGVDLNNTEPLYVDTNAEAIPYRAMYKYRPQNPDELELCEGDTVYVLEQCDDGWYVGSSQRTGRFGTFPGNYVERI